MKALLNWWRTRKQWIPTEPLNLAEYQALGFRWGGVHIDGRKGSLRRY